jgi:hypothetical protein
VALRAEYCDVLKRATGRFSNTIQQWQLFAAVSGNSLPPGRGKLSPQVTGRRQAISRQ